DRDRPPAGPDGPRGLCAARFLFVRKGTVAGIAGPRRRHGGGSGEPRRGRDTDPVPLTLQARRSPGRSSGERGLVTAPDLGLHLRNNRSKSEKTVNHAIWPRVLSTLGRVRRRGGAAGPGAARAEAGPDGPWQSVGLGKGHGGWSSSTQ